MAIIDSILMELEMESGTTRKLLERVPDDKLGWKPHEKSMTLGQLAEHVASLPAMIGASAVLDGFDMANYVPAEPPTTTAELMAIFEKSLADIKAALTGMSDETVTGPWTLSKGGATIFTVPRTVLIRSFTLNHIYHHRGQLSVYLRMLDVAIPSIYGPSADENVFG